MFFFGNKLKKEIERLTLENSKLQSEISQLKSAYSSLLEEKADLTDRLSNYEQLLLEKDQAIQALNDEISKKSKPESTTDSSTPELKESASEEPLSEDKDQNGESTVEFFHMVTILSSSSLVKRFIMPTQTKIRIISTRDMAAPRLGL